MGGEIEYESWPEGLARDARAGAAGVNGNAFVGGVAQARRDVGGGTRPDDAERLDFVDAGVAGKELQKDIVTTDFAGNQPANVVLNPFTLWIEWWHDGNSVADIYRRSP